MSIIRKLTSTAILVLTLLATSAIADSTYPTIGHELLHAEYRVLKHSLKGPKPSEADLQERLDLLDSIVAQSVKRIQTADTVPSFGNIHEVLQKKDFRIHIPTKLLWETLTPRWSKEADRETTPPFYQFDCDTGSFIYLSVFEILNRPVVLVETPRHYFVRWRLAPDKHINWDVNDGASYTDDQHRKGIPRTTLPFDREEELRGFHLRDMSKEEVIAYHCSVISEIAKKNRQVELTMELYHRAMIGRPHKPVPKNNIAWAIATEPLYQEPQELQKALNLATVAVAIDPKHGWIDTLAAVHAAMGNFEKAIETEKTGNNDPERLKAYRNRKSPIEMGWRFEGSRD